MIVLLALTVGFPRLVMSQNITLRLLVHRVNIVVGQINRFNPIARGINDYRGGSSCCAARDQHRRQTYG